VVQKDSSESAKQKPWTLQAEYKLKAEETLRGIQGLPLVILRPALVYGPGDVNGISECLYLFNFDGNCCVEIKFAHNEL
jgi:nucleoside-diphosphate-sugar epimerase